ncbi:hypothetical protein [Stackebrandtia soli]|uniref:hypothetical protein n=1 Tax=Stackebrandtia soli TaxID=1892856 RepID=UPI0039E9A164
MSQFKNSPVVIKVLRALGTGESLTAKEVRARTGSEVKQSHRDKLTDAGFVTVDVAGRTYTYTLTSDGMAYVKDELGGPTEPPAPGALSDKERVALFALLSSEPQVSNADIKRLIGTTIGPAVRSALEEKGLAVILERPIRFELTEKGWRVAEEELSRPADAGDPPLLKLLHHTSARWLSVLRGHKLGLVDMYVDAPISTVVETEPVVIPKTVGARVIDSYADLTAEPGGWASLADLRAHLADVPRDELDEVLTALFRDDRIKLIAEVNQKTLTDADRAAALHIVGDDKHLYSVG